MSLHRIVLSLLTAGAACAAQAFDGTVTVTGSLGATTCGVAVGSQSIAVTLPANTPTGLLITKGDNAGLTPFDISVSNCYGGSSFTISFDSTSTNLDANGRLINNGTAGNVMVEVTTADGSSYYNLRNAAITTPLDSKLGSGKLTLAARYMSLGVGGATPGTVTTNIGFFFNYQ